jgi:hypothetical protein
LIRFVSPRRATRCPAFAQDRLNEFRQAHRRNSLLTAGSVVNGRFTVGAEKSSDSNSEYGTKNGADYQRAKPRSHIQFRTAGRHRCSATPEKPNNKTKNKTHCRAASTTSPRETPENPGTAGSDVRDEIVPLKIRQQAPFRHA